MSSRRAWAFSASYCAVGLVLASVASQIEPRFEAPFQLHWAFFAFAFAVTERFTVDLEVRREAHTLSFTEVVTTVGLIFGVPFQFVLARIVASVAVLVFLRRPQPVKLVFNTGVFAMDAGLSLLLFHLFLGSDSPIEPAGWAAALGAVGIAHLVGAVAVFVVMTVAGAPVSLKSQSVVACISFTAALSGASVALGAASVLWKDSRSWILLLIIAVALGYFFVSFVRVRDRHQGLARLHDFTSGLIGNEGSDSLRTSVAVGVARLLKADRAVLLIPTGESVMSIEAVGGEVTAQSLDMHFLDLVNSVGLGHEHVDVRDRSGAAALGRFSPDGISAPLPLPGREGLVYVEGRISAVRPFDDEDLQLLETAAGHAATALHNSRLVAELREEAQIRSHQALHDEITDLPNSRALSEQLDGQLATGTRLVMMSIRVDSLREVNETLGRVMGDQLLRQVAARLRPLGRRAWCARSGSDEFALVVPGGQDEADMLADRVVAAFDQPVLCDGVALAITVGVGVALAPAHGVESEILLRRASLAASRSRLDGTTVTTWALDRDPYDPQRLTIAADLRDAIPNQELAVHFQPQLDIATNQITGVEALVRWRHPRLGDLRPDQFIAAAENTGAIDALTLYVLEAAARAGARWHAHGWDLDVAVNLSARNLSNPHFAEEVAAVLETTGFDAGSLTLELTESSVMTESERAMGALAALDAQGIQLSIDDFGTGYSSLAHLRRLPVSEIKIDKSFVLDLTTNESDEAIVRSMIELGHNLGLEVVIEGVETVEVRTRLQEMGSDRLQGYLLSRPLALDAFETWAADRRIRRLRPADRRVVNLDGRR